MQSLLTECKMYGKIARLHEFVVLGILQLALHQPSVQSTAVASASDAAYSELWQGYESDVRPMCGNYPVPVQVQLGVAMRQLMELDEPTQMLRSCIWLRIAWQDCRLTWNSSDYNDIVRLTVPRTAVWTPDLTLYDNAESTLGDISDYRINVGSTGDISSLIPVVIKSMCLLNLRTFPFDTQICQLTFGSWTYNGLELNLTAAPNASDISSYVEHGEWDMVSFTATMLSPVFGEVPFPQVVFSIKLKRRPLFYVMNLVFPSLLIKSLAIIGFLLPPESGEKVNLEVTVLLSLSVFQLVVLRTMPPTSENIPIIALFFLLAMVLVALSCVMTVIVLSVHFTEHYRGLPKSFRGMLTGTLGRAFGMNQIVKASWSARKASMQSGGNLVETSLGHDTVSTTSFGPDGRASAFVKADNSSYFDTLAGSATEIANSSGKNLSERPRAALYRNDSITDEGLKSLLHTSKTMLRHLEGLIACQEKKDNRNSFESEWRIFAIFLDRILLCLFFCLGLVLTSSVYLTISTS